MADRIIVIGGGVVGMSAAWALRKRGWDVTVVTERDPGYGASRIHADSRARIATWRELEFISSDS